MSRWLIAILVFGLVSAADAQMKRTLTPLNTRRGGRSRDVMQNGGMSGNKGSSAVKPSTPSESSEERKVEHVDFLGPEKGWGFVTKGTPYFGQDGKSRGKLDAGTPFKYNGIKNSKEASMLVSQAKLSDGTWVGPVLIDCREVTVYSGEYEKIDPGTMGRLQRYYVLNGKVADRRKYLEEQEYRNNPHFESAKAAVKKYQDSIALAAEKEKEMNRQTGIRRSKLQEELRTMKYEQEKLKTAATTENRKYKEWKESHPIDQQKLDRDPELQNLLKQQSELGIKVNEKGN